MRLLPGYRLDRLIGRGGTGEVWLAWTDAPAPRPVAVKRARPGADASAVASLRAEAELLAMCDHPHLLRVLDVVADPPGLALVVPYVGGGSLRDLLDEHGTLGAGAVAALLEPVADAAGWLHRRGLAHGDLKPDNLLLTNHGVPVVADVGVAAIGRAPHPGVDVVGTPAYLDPAVARGGPPGARSDVYSLGVIAYEALTGRLPHRGEPGEVVALAAAGVHRPLATWPAVPPGVAAVVERALEPDPQHRHADPSALVAALRAEVPADEVRLPPRPNRSHAGIGPDPSPSGHETVRLGPHLHGGPGGPPLHGGPGGPHLHGGPGGPGGTTAPGARDPSSGRGHLLVRLVGAVAILAIALAAAAFLGAAAASSVPRTRATRPPACAAGRDPSAGGTVDPGGVGGGGPTACR